MHVTIEETDEGFLLCLHLQPSETSSELRAFASSRPGPNPLPPRLSSTVRPIVSRVVGPALPANLDVGVVRPASGPSRETIVAILDRAITERKGKLPGIVGGLSRGFGNLVFGTGIDPRAGVSMSEQFAELLDTSVAEVHQRLLLPFLGDKTLGSDFGRALVDDLRLLASRGDVEALEANVSFLSGVEERTRGIVTSQSSPGAAFSDPAVGGAGGRAGSAAGRGINLRNADRLLKVVGSLKRQAELNLLLARRVQEAP